MAQNIEIEFKNLLTEDEFNQFTSHFNRNKKDFFHQENHYFDTPNFALKKIGCALRIREKKGQFEMTLKQPHPDGLLETNAILSVEEAEHLLQGGTIKNNIILSQIIPLGIEAKELAYFGTLATDRAEFTYKEGLLVLDVSSYLNTIDYEVEYEVSNREKGQIIFLNLLKELNIPVRRTDNKVKRFYERKKLLQSEGLRGE
jgi:uncharacterized protein YjbK